MYVCMYVCMHACMHAYIPMFVCMHAYIPMFVCMYVHVCARMYFQCKGFMLLVCRVVGGFELAVIKGFSNV